MRVGVFGLSEEVRANLGRSVEVATLTCTVAVASMRSGARAEQRFRCLWRADGNCREERSAATVVASGGRRWEIPRHAGPVVTGSRGELAVDCLVDPRALSEGCDVRMIDEDARYEGRAAFVVEVERPLAARGYDRVLTLDAEFGVVLVDRDLVSGREVRLVGVRFNEELDPELFRYRPEPWRTLIHAQPC
ncbi:MAG TPA: hypothetical protein VFN97_05060 [Actinospica sp.]|nr:hypothetical protein [Actinospica sp.]